MCVLKMKFLPSAVQKLSSEQTFRQTDRWTDRQTDRLNRNYYLLHTQMVIIKDFLSYCKILETITC